MTGSASCSLGEIRPSAIGRRVFLLSTLASSNAWSPSTYIFLPWTT